MIVQDLNDLPRFDDHAVVICDVETTSWDDAVPALNPFQGHRIAGFGLSTEDGSRTWYLPVRHHGEENPLFADQNLPLQAVQHYLRDVFACPTRTYANHNAKFDARFMHFDGIKFLGGFQDVIVLARLVYGSRDRRFGGTGYSLEALATDYLNVHKDARVKTYIKALNTKDWGRVPIRLMGDYAEQDARLTARLRLHLLKHLPAPSITIWAIEQRVSKLLLDSEIFGIPLNVARLKKDYVILLERLIYLLNEIKAIAGYEVNVASSDELDAFLQGTLGITPTAWTDDGKPSWAMMSLESLIVPPGLPPNLGRMLSEASRISHITSTYCQGWLNALGTDGRLHPDFRQWGTGTGRLSSSGPNAQNFDDLAEAWIEEADGRCLVYYDLSQAEYRVFGHYTSAPVIMAAYKENIDTDFHQWLANKLGVSRQFAKTMNFSFIYGMGKKKLIAALSALLAMSLRQGDDRLAVKLHSMLEGGIAMQRGAAMFASNEMAAAAELIYNMYHRTLPEIRQFQRRVGNLCRARGWLKNYYGRVYRIDAARSYVGVNYVVQGTVGDYMKDRSTVVQESCPDLDCHMINEVHDASIWSVARPQVGEFCRRSHVIFETSPFRIPMRADCKVSAATWSQMESLNRGATDAEVETALVKSLSNPVMTWNERESRKQKGTSKKGHGV